MYVIFSHTSLNTQVLKGSLGIRVRVRVRVRVKKKRGGVSLLNHHQCAASTFHLDNATAATGQRHHCTHHTPATSGEMHHSFIHEEISKRSSIAMPTIERSSQ